MITNWANHLKTDQEKQNFLNEVKGSRRVLERLAAMVDELDKAQERIELSAEFYTLPNWKYRQANVNGFRRALNTIKTIINLDQQRDNK